MRFPFNARNRVTQGWSSSHYGLDIVGDDERNIYAVCAGKVATSTIVTNKNDKTWEWGNFVRVDGDDGRRYFYCHLSSRAVEAGQRVDEGTLVGVMGNTGHSFGAHLHLQVRDAQNRELNVAQVIEMPNAVGTYTAQTITPSPSVPTASQLYLAQVGPVSNGDLAKVKALANSLQVPCKISAAAQLYLAQVGPVSNGDLARVKALAASLQVPCKVTAV